MKRNLEDTTGSFAVIENGSNLQTAVMRLEPGEESGPFGNEHGQSEQVLLVVSGVVEARVGDNAFQMKAGDSAIVPKGVAHKFTNASGQVALTFNVYAPRAY